MMNALLYGDKWVGVFKKIVSLRLCLPYFIMKCDVISSFLLEEFSLR